MAAKLGDRNIRAAIRIINSDDILAVRADVTFSELKEKHPNALLWIPVFLRYLTSRLKLSVKRKYDRSCCLFVLDQWAGLMDFVRSIYMI